MQLKKQQQNKRFTVFKIITGSQKLMNLTKYSIKKYLIFFSPLINSHCATIFPCNKSGLESETGKQTATLLII